LSNKGKRYYFRHSLFAHDNEKMAELIDKYGFEYYGLWWLLIELCCEKYVQDENPPYKFHISTLRLHMRKTTQSCYKVLTKLQQSCNIVVTKCEQSVLLDIPNLPKYIGSYSKKDPLNKIKENKIKENKKINKKTPDGVFLDTPHKKNNVTNSKKIVKVPSYETTTDIPHIKFAQEWNRWAENFDIPKVAILNEKRIKEIKKILQITDCPNRWGKTLVEVCCSDFHMGKNDRGWKIDFDFFIKEKNFLKFMEKIGDEVGENS